MNILSNILITALITVLGTFGANKYIPLSWYDSTPKQSFGSTITSILGTDTLSSSRTVINDNFTSLNNGKLESSTYFSTTTHSTITTIPNLTTIGTIGSGIWNGTAIGVGYGGTGTTTPTSNQVMIGNGSSGFKVIGFGTSGQFLTSNGNASAPSWTTSALDNSLNYNWTGTNLFKNLNASSTFANPIILNGISLNTPSTQGASSTILVNNGSGGMTWNVLSRLLTTAPVIGYTSSSASTTRISYTIPGGSIGTQGIIKFTDYLSDTAQSTNNALIYEVAYGNSTTSLVMTNTGADSNVCISPGPATSLLEIIVGGNDATNSQWVTIRRICESGYSTTYTPTFITGPIIFSVDSTINQLLTITARTKGAGGNDRLYVWQKGTLELRN